MLRYFLISLCFLLGGTSPGVLPFSLCTSVSAYSSGMTGYDLNEDIATGQTVKIGILANRGYEICLQEWGPTADYLQETLAPVKFEIVPLNFNQIYDAVRNEEITFIAVNPSYYAFLEYNGLAFRIATLQVRGVSGQEVNFGSVIFTLASRSDINTLNDLEQKVFSAVDPQSLGGWHMALYNMKKNGLDPERDFKALRFEGLHDNVVQAVLSGGADAGAVRSTQLERMADEGLIDLSDFKVLNCAAEQYPDYPYLLSTDLYPEWPIAKIKRADAELTKKVALALLMMKEDDPAASALLSAGWEIPQDYSEVHDLLRFLNLPPYESYGKVTWQQVVRQYRYMFLAITILIIALVLGWVYLRILLSRLREASLRVKESEELFRVLYENAPVSVIVHDAVTCQVIRANENAIRSYGLDTLDEFINMHLWGDVPYSFEDVKEWFRKVNETGLEHFEWKSRAKNGRVFWEEVILQKIFLKQGEYIISTAVDITAKKEREQMIAERYKEEVEVAKNTLQFKQKFLANMSHEIRTPLTGVLGMIDLLDRTSLDDQQKDLLATLKLSGENLREILNQVLDYSRLEAGKLKLHPRDFRMEDVFTIARKLFGSLCVQKDIKFETHIDPALPDVLYGDEVRVTQIVNNLISNAVKFTRKGLISLHAVYLPPQKNDDSFGVKVWVTDTGCGIPANMLKKLFIPFSQIGEVDARPQEGTGLGLSISCELARLMGGDIGVDSRGEGSTFWFTFQVRSGQKQDQQTAEKATASVSQKSLRILYVEDKIINQKVVNLMLTAMGHKVQLAENGEEALHVFSPGLFDLILMDIQMPVMDGITATQRLKEKYQSLPPIVGLSANAFEGDREKYMGMGMDEYLTKPVKSEDFSNLISDLFEA